MHSERQEKGSTDEEQDRPITGDPGQRGGGDYEDAPNTVSG